MRTTVAQLMSVDFVTVTARMSLDDALNLLVESEAFELCVVDAHGRFEGVVSDFELLKCHLHGRLTGHNVGSLISRAVTVLSQDTLVEQALPLFRDGICSRAYICRNGQLLGRLSRTAVLKSLVQKNSTAFVPPTIRPLSVAPAPGQSAKLQAPEAAPRPPQFLSGPVLAGMCVERQSSRHIPCAVRES
ncbi:MAG: HPP family protein [Planctomycetaceae bacterium]